MRKETYRGVLVLVLVTSLALLFLQNVNAITGHVTEGSTYSNVSIQKYLAISFSDNLSQGIDFGDVEVLPTENQSAIANGNSSGTEYYIIVSPDSNTPVDFCVMSNGDLSNGVGDVIALGNESYAVDSTTDALVPALADEVPFTSTYVKSISAIAAGSNAYYRFWLDIPAAQPSGDYDNTVAFKGVTNGQNC